MCHVSEFALHGSRLPPPGAEGSVDRGGFHPLWTRLLSASSHAPVLDVESKSLESWVQSHVHTSRISCLSGVLPVSPG